MLQWIVIGLVIWYFYRRYTRQKQLSQKENHRYIHRDEPTREHRPPPRYDYEDDDDDYIDYEEVK